MRVSACCPGIPLFLRRNATCLFVLLAGAVSVSAAANALPQISLTSPSPLPSAPATVVLSATATDPDGQIVRVRFYRGTTLLGTDLTAPYSYSWKAVYPGTYTFSARAEDNAGGVSTATVVVEVGATTGANAPPTVSLTSPSSGASFTAPATVTLAATAADSNGTIAKVEFLNGTAVLATDTTSPYSFVWSNVPAGTYTVSARATDNLGASSIVSASVSVTQAGGKDFYASPTGSASGDGTLQRPWDLKTALDAPAALVPGATLWLRGGTYRGAFISYLKGTASAPIVVRQYPGERVILDGGGSPDPTLYIRGYFAWYWGFEVMNSDPKRVSAQSGSSPTDLVRNDGVRLYGSDVKLINLTIHDTADGIGFSQQAEDSEVYGCVIFNNGWLGTDRGHGHGIYAQNSAGTKHIVDVVSFNNFATGMKAYATSTYATGFDFDGVIAFNNGSPAERGRLYRQPNLFVGTTTNPSDRISITGTHLYHPAEIEPDLGGNLVLGYLAKNNVSATVTDTRIIGGSMAVKATEWKTLTFRGNTLYATGSSVNTSKQRLVELALASGASPSGSTWTGNEYFDATAIQSTGQRLPFVFNGGAKSTFAQWKQATAFDGASSYQAGPPPTAEVVVEPNRFERGRGHVIVYNWPRSTSIDVDVSTVLTVGTRYEVRNVQDFLGTPVASGTYDGTRVRLPLSGLRVARPIGYDFTPASTAPEFAVFVIVPR